MYKFKRALVATLVFWMGSVCAHHFDLDSIEKRIQPSASVYQAGDDVPVTKPAVVETSGPRSGKVIFESKCISCHGTGVMGAPKLGVAADWSARMAKGEEALIHSAINGFNMMPPRGTCSDCSDDELKETVLYMVKASQ